MVDVLGTMFLVAFWISVVFFAYWAVAFASAMVLLRRYRVEKRNSSPMTFWVAGAVCAALMMWLSAWVVSEDASLTWAAWQNYVTLGALALLAFWGLLFTFVASHNDMDEVRKAKDALPVFTGDPTI